MNKKKSFYIDSKKIYYILIIVFVSILYLYRLSYPNHYFVFDETYYVKDAMSLLKYGVEIRWHNPIERTNFNFINKHITQPIGKRPEFIVHPPLGKWFIALGLLIKVNSFFWRIPSVLFAVSTICLVMAIAYTLYQKHLIAIFAGIILACDGIFFTMGRTAMLDIFLTFFYTLISYISLNFTLKKNFSIFRYLLFASILCGAAASIKWSGIYIYPLVLFLAIYKYFYTIKSQNRRELIFSKIKNIFSIFSFSGIITLITYMLTWSGWFISPYGFYRHHNNSSNKVFDAIYNFFYYQFDMFKVSKEITSYHVYGSKAYTWFLLYRPVILWRNKEGNHIKEIMALPTPFLWLFFLSFLIVYIAINISSKNTLTLYPVLILLLIYIPWLFLFHRTIFSFYSVAFSPFVVLTVAGMLNLIVEEFKNKIGIILAISIVCCIVFNFFYFYPIYSGMNISVSIYKHLIWFNSWN